MLSFSIDIGNSRIKIGLFKGRSLLKTYNFQNSNPPKSEFDDLLVERAIVSSVLGTEETEKKIRFYGNEVVLLDQNCKLPLDLLYETPQTLGKDRLAAVVGAKSQFPNEDVLVIDAGTCLTYDFLNRNAEYFGGAISPGIQMRLKAMHHFTARLPFQEWDSESGMELIGNSTETALLSGAINGAVAEMDGLIGEYRSQYPSLKIVLTGGDSSFFEKKLKNTIFADSNLVLKGLNEILFFNSENH